MQWLGQFRDTSSVHVEHDVPVGLNGSGCVFHLHILVTHESPGTQTAWIQLQRSLKIQSGFLMLRAQAVVVPCGKQINLDVFMSIVNVSVHQGQILTYNTARLYSIFIYLHQIMCQVAELGLHTLKENNRF